MFLVAVIRRYPYCPVLEYDDMLTVPRQATTIQSIYQIFAFFILVIGRCEDHVHVSVLASVVEDHVFHPRSG